MAFCYLVLLVQAPGALAQQYSSSIEGQYRVAANVTYLTDGDWEGKLDVYGRTDVDEPLPTLVWVHGGSLTRGRKETQVFRLLPWLEQGWNVVNVAPRNLGVTGAPEAARNIRCALRWVHQNGEQRGFDTERIVISGSSSGALFSIMATMAQWDHGWDDLCPGSEEPEVAAVVSWYGGWDLADVLEGPNERSWAIDLVRGHDDPMAVAKRLSALPIDGRDVPPVISIHGDADPTAPYNQTVRLHEALEAAGIAEELVTIPNGEHGGFTRDENRMIYEAIRAFLARQGIGPTLTVSD